MPSMKWTKNGKGLGDSVGTDQTPEFCRIQLKSPVRGDLGNYELELFNSVGKDTVPITINVLGKDLTIISLSMLYVHCGNFGTRVLHVFVLQYTKGNSKILA